MTTPSGQISLNDVNVELGLAGTTLITMNDANVRTLAGVGGSGTPISMQNLQNKSNRVSISYTYSSSTANASLNLSAIGGYSAGKSDITVTINGGVYLYATTTGGYALALSGGTTGDTLTIVNNGFIMGQGGKGGGAQASSAAVLSTAGGPALNLGFGMSSCTINNTNGSAYIGGGGGGGGAGNAMGPVYVSVGVAGGGGAGGGAGGDNVFSAGGTPKSPNPQQFKTGGAGGGLGGAGGSGQVYTLNGYNESVGGGGGGRIFPGSGGGGGYYTYAASGGGAGGGGAGNNVVGGAGGSASSAGASQGGTYGAGGGGGWGASGGTGWSGGGGAGPTYAASAAGGKAVNLNGKSITWVSGDTSRVYGAVS